MYVEIPVGCVTGILKCLLQKNMSFVNRRKQKTYNCYIHNDKNPIEMIESISDI